MLAADFKGMTYCMACEHKNCMSLKTSKSSTLKTTVLAFITS